MRYSYLYGAEGTPVAYSLSTYKDKTRFVVAAFLSCVFVIGIVSSKLINASSNTVQASPDTVVQAEKEPTPETGLNSIPSVATDQNLDTNVSIIKSQTIDLSAWLLSHGGQYSVSLYEDGSPLSDVKSSEQYFMASIYKLYVAYIGYQKVDQGVWNYDEPAYFEDWTRGKCLDEMIRSSHSPCGEKMMAEIGTPNIQAVLNEYGLENTSFTQFVTSSADVANVLIRLQKNLDLSPVSTERLMSSMEGQIYRDALPKGFDDWKMYDKVGFRDQNEYHDVGIIVSPQGKTYIIAVLSNGAGTNNLANLAQTIKQSLK